MSLEGSHNDANDNTRLYGVIKNTPKNSFYLEKVYDYFDDEEPRQTARGVELLLIAAGIKANGPKPKAGDWAISFRVSFIFRATRKIPTADIEIF